MTIQEAHEKYTTALAAYYATQDKVAQYRRELNEARRAYVWTWMSERDGSVNILRSIAGLFRSIAQASTALNRSRRSNDNRRSNKAI